MVQQVRLADPLPPLPYVSSAESYPHVTFSNYLQQLRGEPFFLRKEVDIPVTMFLYPLIKPFRLAPFERILPCRIYIGQNNSICLVKGLQKVVKEVPRSRIPVGLEHRYYPLVPSIPGGRKGPFYLLGVVPVIVHNSPPARLSLYLEPPL